MDRPCPIEAKPLASIRSDFVDDDQIQTENISSPTPLIVPPLEVVEPFAASDDVTREKSMVLTPFQDVRLSGVTFNTTLPIHVEPLASYIVDTGSSSLPTKRRPGRPKGSKNISSHRVVQPVASDDVTEETPIKVTPLQTMRPPGEAYNTTPIYVKPQQSIRPNDASGIDDVGTSSVRTKRGRPKGSKNSMTTPKKPRVCDSSSKERTSFPNFDSGITEAEKDTGNKDLVDLVLMRFDALRRRLCQLGHWKAITTSFSNCINSGSRTNLKKRIGPIPGVAVGDIFYLRDEMCLVGLHKQPVAGIDYLTDEDGAEDGHLATSVVTSGHYDEVVGLYNLIYTGQGGTEKNGQACSHKLERGNLALETSRMKGNEVRVIRGVEDPHNKNKKIYIYDGLYSVNGFWTVNGRNNVDEFRFGMQRKSYQPLGYETWKLAERLRKECLFSNTRKGFILEDISYGNEFLPVSLVNEFDENKQIPEVFEYTKSQYDSNTKLEVQVESQALVCIDSFSSSCQYGNCICIQKNGGKSPYHENLLVCRKPMIYECGDSCPCPNNCNNHVVQTGLKIRLEVFKTVNCGWGLRSWEPIRAGTFICKFVGLKKAKEEVEEEDEYLFDTSRIYKPFKWNYEPELVGEHVWEPVPEVFNIPSPVLISARQQGNVARFMNHSCSPNVFWQPIEYEQEGELHIRIGFFAMKHIPPLTELRYDYGGSFVEKIGEDETLIKGKKTCLCGSLNCRGSFG